ncbi:hypothetical protein PR202_ga00772 [Eleusine coracana subsp. coracana]|uniref:Uncharacterized protein n=1 Tax=Eleusine coracana subsp. coracana TaxID=191504 RepID=A0AAV5BIB6_ELECO|nr:hypothetical protein PR202_ga00772 [Eleusine coracana subsp. coracana]
MLLIYTRTSSSVPLKILSIEDGTVLKSFSHLLHRNKKVDFIEQFNEKLLVKQEGENLQILDVRNFQLTEVSRTEFMTPSAFIFLYELQLFLTFRNRSVAVWNFRAGSINVSSILTGKCLAKIKSGNECKEKKAWKFQNTVAEALEDITALYYDEDRVMRSTPATDMALFMRKRTPTSPCWQWLLLLLRAGRRQGAHRLRWKWNAQMIELIFTSGTVASTGGTQPKSGCPREQRSARRFVLALRAARPSGGINVLGNRLPDRIF